VIQIVFFLISIIFSFAIFYDNRGDRKLQWMIIALLVLNGNILVIDLVLQVPITRWLIYSFLFSCFLSPKRLRTEFKEFPFRFVLIALFAGTLMVAIPDPRLSVFYKIYKPISELISTVLLLFLGYFVIHTKSDILRIAKPIFITTLVIALVGVYNWITQTNPYYELVINTYLDNRSVQYQSFLRNLIADSGRYRASSTFNHSFNYGYASCLLSLFSFSIYLIHKPLKKLALFATFAGLIGVVLCFSRTILLCAFISFTILFLFSTTQRKKIYLFFGVIFIGLSSYYGIPAVKESVDNTTDIFITGGSNTRGSSVGMRVIQFYGAYKYLMQSPIRGNGYDYINKELGWANPAGKRANKDMFGFESIIYVLMIEQGLIGLITKFIFFVLLCIYFFKKRKINKVIANLGFAIVILFLSFSMATGALGAWPITMLFTGLIIKTLELQERAQKHIVE